jgi:hypothetical protein
MRTPPPPPFVRDPGTWASYLLLGYFSFVLSTFGGVLPSLRLELGLSFSGASQHSSLFALGLLLASLGGERLAQRFGAAWPLWGGALGMAVGVALVLGARSVLWSLTGFFLMGLLGALTLIQVSAELSANHGPNRHAEGAAPEGPRRPEAPRQPLAAEARQQQAEREQARVLAGSRKAEAELEAQRGEHAAKGAEHKAEVAQQQIAHPSAGVADEGGRRRGAHRA